MIVRLATAADAGDLARMNAAFNGVSDSAAQIAARLAACAEIETALVAELDGQVGGFACVRVVPCVLYAEPYAELTELYDSVMLDKPVYHDGRWGMATLEVCLALFESSREHREINLTHQVPVHPDYDRGFAVA